MRQGRTIEFELDYEGKKKCSGRPLLIPAVAGILKIFEDVHHIVIIQKITDLGALSLRIKDALVFHQDEMLRNIGLRK